MPREMRPRWDTCSVPNCGRPTIDMETMYCADHVPVTGFVTNEQMVMARQLMKRGATLYQASMRTRCDPRDLDLALWRRLGTPIRPEAQF